MVKFVDIDPAEIDTSRTGRRGRVSYPIVKAFMERNTKVSKLDLIGLDKNPNYVRSMLHSYCKNHKLPIRVFTADGDIHMMRLDLDNDHNPIEWSADMETTEGAVGHERNMEPEPINAKTVKKRAAQERGKTTK